jgi:RHS repeat-associated protein
MNRFFRVLCLLLLSIGPVAFAQNLGTGLYAFGSFDSKGFDTINLGNLNTHFEIPIVNKQGRGMNFTYSLVYDGLVWAPSTSTGTGYWEPDPSWGFHGQLLGGAYTGYLTYTQSELYCPASGVGHPPPGIMLVDFVYHDPYGKNHWFNYQLKSCPLTGDVITGNGASSDGSGLSYGISDGLIHTRNGSIINAPTGTSAASSNITDSNGNVITNNGNGTFTDTLGVTALSINGAGTPSSPMTFTYPVTLQANGAPSATATVAYRAYTVQTNFQCSGITEYGATSVDLVNQIILADGSTYSFNYEATPGVAGAVTGRLASITLPTGGTISYTYSGGCNGLGINADGTTGGLTRATTDGSKTYTRATVNANATSTTVQDEKSNQSLYQFTIASSLYYETHRQIYQGALGGSLLKDQYTCYNGVQPNCDGVATSLPFTQTTTVTSYNSGTQLAVANTYDAYGMLTSSNQAGSAGLLTSTTNTYNSFEEVLTSSTTDGSGIVVSASSYGYDAKGNQILSQVSPGNGAAALSTTTTYNTTGSPITVTTPNGMTQYGYDSTQTFATSTTLPTPASGVSLASGANYDPQSGALLSSTGLNAGQTTTVTQYDTLLRPLGITLPNNGQVGFSYSTNQRGVSRSTGTGASADTETLFDAYGRTSRVAILNGQSSNPWYQTDYCYDATGLLQFKPVRYQGNGWGTPIQCSGNGTSYLYDALGRVTSVTTPDGTTSYQYYGRAVEKTDVNGVQTITQYDLLGRISAVCEISSNTYQQVSPVACGMDITGTGFLTTYAYNLANHTTTITQGAQQRVVQTDAAGRTIYTSEPERGVTTYSYAYNGTGLVVTRQRPRANQGNSSLLTSTVTQYDSLGRVLSVTYNDQLTPNKQFDYDAVNAAMQWNQTTTNLNGKLADMASGSGTSLTRGLFSYDIMGHVATMWQCAPSICGTSSQAGRPALQFSYDLLGNLTYEFDGASGGIAYTRSPAGEVTSITNQSYQDTYNPANLVSNVVNGPTGPISYTLGNGLNIYKGYDSFGRLYAQWVCNGPAQFDCNTQLYGTDAFKKGVRVTTVQDTVMAGTINLGYDEFNRLTASNETLYSGAQNSFSYGYDRYGNRWSQTVTQGSGPSPSLSFNPANNQMMNGYTYDAAGNLTWDGFHGYTYDAEGNVLSVDNGSTGQYVYDALNRRVSAQTAAAASEYLYDYAGRRLSSWITSIDFGNEGRIYWDGQQIAYRAQNGQTFFEHQDILGTERARTNYLGQIAGTFPSLAFGDGYSESSVLPGADQDNHFFAQLDKDSESTTEHAQFRQYSPTEGRWMSPDPYDGSYRASTPQSFNRYAYAMNRPLSGIDPLGLDLIDPPVGGDGGGDGCPYFDCINVPAPPDPPSAPLPPDGCIGTCGAQPPEATPPPTPPAQHNNGKQLDPSNQECKALANKIANLLSIIEDKQAAIDTNPLGLPEFGPPGAPNRASIQGHRDLLDQYKQNLANRAHEYNQKCGGGDPFSGGASASEPSAAPSSGPSVAPEIKRDLTVVGGLIVVGGVVMVCPECLLAAPAF